MMGNSVSRACWLRGEVRGHTDQTLHWLWCLTPAETWGSPDPVEEDWPGRSALSSLSAYYPPLPCTPHLPPSLHGRFITFYPSVISPPPVSFSLSLLSLSPPFSHALLSIFLFTLLPPPFISPWLGAGYCFWAMLWWEQGTVWERRRTVSLAVREVMQ